MIDFDVELDRLAADLTVLHVTGGAGTRVDWGLEALTAIRALDQVELHTARAALIRRYSWVDHRLKTVPRINALRVAQFLGASGWLTARNGSLHRPTIRPTAALRQCLQGPILR